MHLKFASYGPSWRERVSERGKEEEREGGRGKGDCEIERER
jgi:hypothetical protein